MNEKSFYKLYSTADGSVTVFNLNQVATIRLLNLDREDANRLAGHLAGSWVSSDSN